MNSYGWIIWGVSFSALIALVSCARGTPDELDALIEKDELLWRNDAIGIAAYSNNRWKHLTAKQGVGHLVEITSGQWNLPSFRGTDFYQACVQLPEDVEVGTRLVLRPVRRASETFDPAKTELKPGEFIVQRRTQNHFDVMTSSDNSYGSIVVMGIRDDAVTVNLDIRAELPEVGDLVVQRQIILTRSDQVAAQPQ